MAQSLLELFPVLENQSAVVVQSFLESHAIESAGELCANVDDGDVFVCGKCKKQFNALLLFVNHKREQCGGSVVTISNDSGGHAESTATVSTRGIVSYSTENHSTCHAAAAFQDSVAVSSGASVSLSQFSQNVVLNETELMSLTGLETASLTFPLNSMTSECHSYSSDSGVKKSHNLQYSSSSTDSHLSSLAVKTMVPLLSVQSNTCSTRLSSPTVFTMAPMRSPASSVLAKTLAPICAIDLDKSYVHHHCSAKDFVSLSACGTITSDHAVINNTDSCSVIEKKNANDPVTYSIVTELQLSSDGESGTLNISNNNKEHDGAVDIETIINNSDANVVPDKPKKRVSKKTAKVDNKKTIQLKCVYCDKAFSKNFDLQQHVRCHTGEKPFQCIVCGRAFAQKSNVKKHMQTHKVWPDGLSNTLPNQLSTGTDLSSVSVGINTDPTVVKCSDICQTINDISSGEELSSCIEEVIDVTDEKKNAVIDSSYLCRFCNQTFKTYFRLKTHLKTHKNEQVYKCIFKSCGQTFHELDTFLEHAKTHENEMNYRCHICSKTFSSLIDLGVHQYTHTNQYTPSTRVTKTGPRYYRCTKCMNKYATPEALDHHMTTTTHSYPCPLCKKVFPCERYLRRHLPRHGSGGFHDCPECHKNFRTEHYLKVHRLIHSGEKPFPCPQCNVCFNRKDKLKRHLLIHNPVKNYKCPFRNYTGCMKEFHRQDKLKAHILTHSGLRPYKCRKCGRSFSRPSHLREHEQIHRNNEDDDVLQLVCQDCNKRFTSNKKLLDHSRTCGNFRKRADFSRHKRTRSTRDNSNRGQVLPVGGNGSECYERKRLRSGKDAVSDVDLTQRQLLPASKDQLLDNSRNLLQPGMETGSLSGMDRAEQCLEAAGDFSEVHFIAEDLLECSDRLNRVDVVGDNLNTIATLDSTNATTTTTTGALVLDGRDCVLAGTHNDLTLVDVNTLQPLVNMPSMPSPLCLHEETMQPPPPPHSQVTLMPCEVVVNCQPVILTIAASDKHGHHGNDENNRMCTNGSIIDGR